MKSSLIINVVLFMILSGIIVIGFVKIGQEQDEAKSRIGEKVVIKDDTLLIIDYSILQGSYVLEDGRKIHVELAKKHLIE